MIFSFLFSSFSLRFLSSKTTPTKLTLSQRLGVGHHLLLVRNKFSALRLVQRAGQSGDGVVVGPSLESREHREVDLVLDVVGDLLSLLVDGADACFVGEGVEGGRWGGGGGELSSMKKKTKFFSFSFLSFETFSLCLSTKTKHQPTHPCGRRSSRRAGRAETCASWW